MERERERDSFGILYTYAKGYLLFIIKIKREIERERKREYQNIIIKDK